MAKTVTRRIIRFSLITVSILFLALAGLYVRLAVAPLSLSWGLGRLETALGSALPGYQIDLDGVSAQLNGLDVQLSIQDFQLSRDDQGFSLTIPRATASLSALPLIWGDIRPTAANVDQLRMVLEIDATLLTNTGGQSPAGDGGAQANMDLSILSSLKSARLVGGSIVLRDRSSQVEWLVQDIDALFRPAADGRDLAVTASLWTEGADQGSPLAAKMRSRPGSYQLEMSISDWNPAAYTAPVSADYALDAPLDLEVAAMLGPDMAPLSGTVSAKAGEGSIIWADAYDGPRGIQQAQLDLHLEDDQLILDTAEILLSGGNRLAASGSIEHPLTDPQPQLSASFDRLSVPTLVHYWPAIAAHGGRRWVAGHIDRGFVKNGAFRLDTHGFTLDFDFEGLSVRYLTQMPEATSLSGSGRLTADDLTLTIETGEVANLSIGNSQVLLFDFRDKPAQAEIQLILFGDVADVLLLADHEPLGFISPFGVSPADSRGSSRTALALNFPLEDGLGLDQVQVAVHSNMSDAHISVAPLSAALDDASLQLAVTNDGLELWGNGMVDGLPLSLEWFEVFGDAGSSRYLLDGMVGAQQLTALGLPVGEEVQGGIGMMLALEQQRGGPLQGSMTADLSQASLDFPLLDWQKPEQQAARLSANFSFGDDAAVTDILLQGDGIAGQGAALLSTDGVVRSIRVDQLLLGGNALSGRYELGDDGGRHLTINADSLNLAPFIRLLSETGGATPASQDPSGPAAPLVADVKAATATLLNGVTVGDLTAHATRTEQGWEQAALSAEFSDDHFLNASLDEYGTGRRLEISGNDAGSTLRGLGIFANALGGTVGLSAEVSDVQVPRLAANGTITVYDFRLVRTRAINALIEAGAAQGLDDFVGDKGLRVEELVLPFHLQQGVIDIDKAFANGPRLGVTLEGEVDEALDRINVNGIIVPAYRFNSLINNIPIIGRILAGGKGEGLFALNYRVSGEFANPSVEVRRLTALAPGIVRGLFEHRKGRLADLDTEQ